MPVSGRIDRKENLRSKIALKKTTKVTTKSCKENVPNSDTLDFISDDLIVDNKPVIESELIIEPLTNCYVVLEDIKHDKLVNEKSKIKNKLKVSDKQNHDDSDKEELNEAPIKSSKKKTKITNEIRVELMDIENMEVDEDKTENQDNMTDRASTISGLEELVPETNKKRGGRAPTKKREIIPDETVVEKRKDKKVSKKKDQEQEEPKIIEIVQPPVTKLGRRNAFQQKNTETESTAAVTTSSRSRRETVSTKLANVGGDEIDVRSELPVSSGQTSIADSNDVSNKDHKEQQESKTEKEKKSVKKSQTSRLPKVSTKRPFVVEKDDNNNKNAAVVAPVEKIPGLVMLQNVRARKSALITGNIVVASSESKRGEPAPVVVVAAVPQVEVEVPAVVPPVIPGLRMTADIRRRKSELIGVASSTTPAVATVAVAVPSGDKKRQKSPTPVPIQSSLVTDTITATPKKSRSTTKQAPPTTAPSDIAEIIPGMAMMAKKPSSKAAAPPPSSYKRASIHRQKQDQQKQSTPPIDIIPGLSATTQLRRQKMEIAAAVASNNAASTDASSHHHNQTIVTPVATPTVTTVNARKLSAVVPQSPMPTKSVIRSSLSSASHPIGILSKPSPYKRPMSCITDDNDNGGNDGTANKRFRTTSDADNGGNVDGYDTQYPQGRRPLEKRQSVTFNRAVEVKEIHGNSFNSVATVSDDEGPLATAGANVPMPKSSIWTSHQRDGTASNTASEAASMAQLQQRVAVELERTRNRLADKRSRQAGSNMNTSIIGSARSASMYASSQSHQQSLPKKSSGLSELMTARAKEHRHNSPPTQLSRPAHVTNAGIASRSASCVTNTGSGALRKLAAITQHSQQQPQQQVQWKSFHQAPPPQQQSQYNYQYTQPPPSVAASSLSARQHQQQQQEQMDQSMTSQCSDSSETGKSKCVVM